MINGNNTQHLLHRSAGNQSCPLHPASLRAPGERLVPLNEKAKWFLIRFMGSYSLDLRKRIIDAVERGEHTKSEIAEMFNVHESFIYIQDPSSAARP